MDNQTPAQIISERISSMAEAATKRYNERFNNKAYTLRNDAMFLCGHPHYTRSNRDWSENVLEFLALFC